MSIQEIFDRPMERVSESVFCPRGEKESLGLWDKLAAFNPIHAAISQDDESGEIKKGASEYEAVLRETGGGSILDLGCGYGRLAKHVLPQRSFGLYAGLDGSEAMLAEFEKRYLAHPAERRTPLVLVKGGIDDLPFRDSSFDCVFTSAVWLHNPKETVKRSVSEVIRVLKPGGKLLATGSFPNVIPPAGWQSWLYTEIVLRLLGKTGRNGPVRSYTEKEVRELMRGFSAFDIRRSGCRLLPTQLMILPRKLNRWTWKKFAVPFNGLVCRLLGTRSAALCSHFDVLATKGAE